MEDADDGDEIAAIMRAYRANIPAEDKLAVNWTLDKIVRNEEKRLVDFVREKDPSWYFGKNLIEVL